MDRIHLRAPRGWINDPNGFIYYKGEYHLFYQHFPYAPAWGRMHWGHAISKDLTSWEHLDIALYPSKKNDQDGCFSGSAIEKDGVLNIIYTGIEYLIRDPNNTNCTINDKFIASQMKITSSDGYHFDNINDKRVIIEPIRNDRVGDMTNTRDPKVFKGDNDKYYVILGSTCDSKGRLLVYSSDDLNKFEFKSFYEDKNFGWMYECPDYFTVNNQGYVLFSPMDRERGNDAYYVKAYFDYEKEEIRLDKELHLFDYGMDLYAPQSNVDENGNRIVISWLRTFKKNKNGSIGVFAIPRIAKEVNGKLYFRPHPNIKKQFTKKTTSLEGCTMFTTTIEEGEEINVGGYLIKRDDGIIYTDRTAVVDSKTDIKTTFRIPVKPVSYELEVYVDYNIIEVYINGGEYTITNAFSLSSDELRSSLDKEIEIYTIER